MPLEIVNLVTPVFLVIITGFLSGHVFKLFKPEASEILIKFAFYVAVPAMLLVVLTTTPIKEIINWDYIFTYGAGTLGLFLLIGLGCKIILGKSLSESTIIASLSTLTNMAFVGLPLTLALFGHQAVAPATLSIILIVIVFYPLIILLLELGQQGSDELGAKMKKTFKSVMTNPLILPAIIGVILSACNFRFPAMIESYFKIFESALTPCALFAIGLGIEIKHIKGYFKDIVFITILKLVVAPAVVLVLAKALNVSPLYTILAVIAVAVPPAKSIYVFGSQYDTIKDETAAMISFSTLVSILTLFLWLLLFANLYPSLFIQK